MQQTMVRHVLANDQWRIIIPRTIRMVNQRAEWQWLA